MTATRIASIVEQMSALWRGVRRAVPQSRFFHRLRRLTEGVLRYFLPWAPALIYALFLFIWVYECRLKFSGPVDIVANIRRDFTWLVMFLNNLKIPYWLAKFLGLLENPSGMRTTGFDLLEKFLRRLEISSDMSTAGETLLQAMLRRETDWLSFIGWLMVASMAVTMLLHFFWYLWSASYSKICLSRRVSHVVIGYRVTMAVIFLVNAGLAWCLYVFGVKHIADQTLWDFVYFFMFPPLLFAACRLFRTAAPACVSGKNCFFRR